MEAGSSERFGLSDRTGEIFGEWGSGRAGIEWGGGVIDYAVACDLSDDERTFFLPFGCPEVEVRFPVH